MVTFENAFGVGFDGHNCSILSCFFGGWVVLEEELSAHENKFRFGFDLLKDLFSLVF